MIRVLAHKFEHYIDARAILLFMNVSYVLQTYMDIRPFSMISRIWNKLGLIISISMMTSAKLRSRLQNIQSPDWIIE